MYLLSFIGEGYLMEKKLAGELKSYLGINIERESINKIINYVEIGFINGN